MRPPVFMIPPPESARSVDAALIAARDGAVVCDLAPLRVLDQPMGDQRDQVGFTRPPWPDDEFEARTPTRHRRHHVLDPTPSRPCRRKKL